uniref:(California timema) hypothetical protein n=1 Tax=Timema californicum TaxID=61474 RepID=A0A7R9J7X2_TIMCA|nr:unnamed protein product [Timema californicum]
MHDYRLDASQKECRMHPSNIVNSPTAESAMYMKVDGKDIPVREGPRVRGTREQMSTILDASGNLIYTNRQQQASQSLQCGELTRDSKRGVLSQLIEKVRTKEDRKKSPIQEEPRLVLGRERSKSDGRGGAGSSELCRSKMMTSQQSEDLKQCSNVKAGTFRSAPNPQHLEELVVVEQDLAKSLTAATSRPVKTPTSSEPLKHLGRSTLLKLLHTSSPAVENGPADCRLCHPVLCCLTSHVVIEVDPLKNEVVSSQLTCVIEMSTQTLTIRYNTFKPSSFLDLVDSMHIASEPDHEFSPTTLSAALAAGLVTILQRCARQLR